MLGAGTPDVAITIAGDGGMAKSELASNARGASIPERISTNMRMQSVRAAHTTNSAISSSQIKTACAHCAYEFVSVDDRLLPAPLTNRMSAAHLKSFQAAPDLHQ